MTCIQIDQATAASYMGRTAPLLVFFCLVTKSNRIGVYVDVASVFGLSGDTFEVEEDDIMMRVIPMIYI